MKFKNGTPVEGTGPEIVDLVIKEMAVKTVSPIPPGMADDLRERADLGHAKKYPHPLRANNGRDARVDLLEELYDGAQYARQRIEEGKASRAVEDAYALLLDLAARIKAELSKAGIE